MVALRAEMTVNKCDFFVSPDRFSHDAWTAYTAHSDLIGLKEYACFVVTCHLHFWQNDWGLLCATAVTQGWNGYSIRVSTQS